jgi:hypothetical protein
LDHFEDSLQGIFFKVLFESNKKLFLKSLYHARFLCCDGVLKELQTQITRPLWDAQAFKKKLWKALNEYFQKYHTQGNTKMHQNRVIRENSFGHLVLATTTPTFLFFATLLAI